MSPRRLIEGTFFFVSAEFVISYSVHFIKQNVSIDERNQAFILYHFVKLSPNLLSVFHHLTLLRAYTS